MARRCRKNEALPGKVNRQPREDMINQLRRRLHQAPGVARRTDRTPLREPGLISTRFLRLHPILNTLSAHMRRIGGGQE